MNVLNIVFGRSCYSTMKKSKLNNEGILMFNVKFNVGDLSNVVNHKIKIPEELYFEESDANFENEYNTIIDNIIKKNKIRVWLGRKDIYSSLIMLYVCSIIKKYNYELYVLYSEEYNRDYLSPSVMREEELEELSKLEHKLTETEINNNVKIWNNLVSENSDFRIISDGYVKSVSIDFYDNYILENLKSIGKVKMNKLVEKLMKDIYLSDNMWAYLIDRLIENKKIKIILDDNIRYFENLIEINDK